MGDLMNSNNNLALIGGGGHCMSVLDAALRQNAFGEIMITDHTLTEGTTVLGCPVIGDDDRLADLFSQGASYAFITLGSQEDTSLRRRLASQASSIGYTFPNIIDPAAVVSAFAHMGTGVFVGKTAVINAGAEIGDHAIINTGAIIEHECHIGAFTHISVNAALCGKVSVGSDCFIGPGAVIGHNVRIGNHAIIGANTTVLKDIPPGAKRLGGTA